MTYYVLDGTLNAADSLTTVRKLLMSPEKLQEDVHSLFFSVVKRPLNNS